MGIADGLEEDLPTGAYDRCIFREEIELAVTEISTKFAWKNDIVVYGVIFFIDWKVVFVGVQAAGVRTLLDRVRTIRAPMMNSSCLTKLTLPANGSFVAR